MEEFKLNEILKEFKKDSEDFKAKVITINEDLRGNAKFTNQVWEGTHVPVNKLFDRGSDIPYRFVDKDILLIMETRGARTGRPIYYACEVINNIPSNNWWYFDTKSIFKDCETLMEAY